MYGNETFSSVPTRVKGSLSKYHWKPTTSGDFVAGRLVPVYVDTDIMPGDIVKISMNDLIRMSTPVGVPMDNLYRDIFAFFVPNKDVLRRQSMAPSVTDGNHSWAAFLGAQDGMINMPVPGDIRLPGLCVHKKNNGNSALAKTYDWLGQDLFESSEDDYYINPFVGLAIADVWNRYFRDPNGSMNPLMYTIDSPSQSFGEFTGRIKWQGGPSGFITLNDTDLDFGKWDLLPVCRFHGYVGSVLPWPQRSLSGVIVPMGESAPVGLLAENSGAIPQDYENVVLKTGGEWPVQNGEFGSLLGYNAGTGGLSIGRMVVDLTKAIGANVNQVRLSFACQRWYESLARCGNGSLADITSGLFGVDMGLKKEGAEFLGSNRKALNVIQVNNTSSDVGQTGSFSLTNSNDQFLVKKGFVEHGTLIIFCVVRHDDTFHQGIEKMYRRAKRFDFFQPQFANLGNEVFDTGYIYRKGEGQTFGYVEYGAEYRMKMNHVTGHLRPNQSLGYYTYANHFTTTPTLGGFLDASKQVESVDRTLKVKSTTSGFQFVGQFMPEITITRHMPTYSIPGLIDHC